MSSKNEKYIKRFIKLVKKNNNFLSLMYGRHKILSENKMESHYIVCYINKHGNECNEVFCFIDNDRRNEEEFLKRLFKKYW